ncbi:hypothetical protein ACTFIW_009881 [Dictyostelium discoideum]
MEAPKCRRAIAKLKIDKNDLKLTGLKYKEQQQKIQKKQQENEYKKIKINKLTIYINHRGTPIEAVIKVLQKMKFIYYKDENYEYKFRGNKLKWAEIQTIGGDHTIANFIFWENNQYNRILYDPNNEEADYIDLELISKIKNIQHTHTTKHPIQSNHMCAVYCIYFCKVMNQLIKFNYVTDYNIVNSVINGFYSKEKEKEMLISFEKTLGQENFDKIFKIKIQ